MSKKLIKIGMYTVKDDQGKLWVLWEGWLYRLGGAVDWLDCKDYSKAIEILTKAGYIAQDPIDELVQKALDNLDKAYGMYDMKSVAGKTQMEIIIKVLGRDIKESSKWLK